MSDLAEKKTETLTPNRLSVARARRTVLKLGTRVLTHDDGRLALARLSAIVETAAALHRADRDVLMVSSGAVELGREVLGLEATPLEIELRQVCAAVGQTRLMAIYQDALSQFGLVCAQVLLSQGDFGDRTRYLNLRRTLNSLLGRRVVPILNENDAVAIEELEMVDTSRRVFGDNDQLSALVASKLDADLLVLLTDVEGIYDKNPRQHADARLILRCDEPSTLTGVSGSGSAASRGGMRSKVEAARVAARGGCQAVIASGRESGHLERVLRGEDVGTFFPASGHLRARDRWIAFAAAPRGTLHLDQGAVEALRGKGASLLAAGVRQVEGDFRPGDVVELRGPDGDAVGRGHIPWSGATVRAWCQGSPPPGVSNGHCLIRRNYFVLEV